MKTTKYFQFRRLMQDREAIRDEWIAEIVKNPSRKIVQDDGRIRLWGVVESLPDRYIRVILLEDGETVHNAFFDRTYKEKKS